MRTWKDADGNVIDDQALYTWIEGSKNKILGDCELIVGVDSHLHGVSYRFITVICLYRKGRGGFYYYNISEKHRKDFKGPYPARVKARMFYETTLAIEAATEILEKTELAPVVHIDASPPNAGELTSMFSEDLKGYVVASGFEGVLKPWSFAASGIANKHTK